MDKKSNNWKIGAGAAGAVAAAKAVGGAGLLKGGFLFKTGATLFVSLALYARLYGWEFGVLVIALLLIHEMGHWIWMKMRGLSPEAPVFVPFMGAYVAMKNMPGDEATHAWVAFAGPLVGSIGAVAIYTAGAMTNNAALMAGGNFGFYLNLLQLIPAKPLDGGFIASAVSKWLLIPGTIIVLLLGFLCQSILLIIIGGLSFFSLFKRRKATAEGGEELKPATWKQRLGIGAAYISLALFLGGIQVFAQLQIASNKSYAAGQITYLTDQLQHGSDPDLLRKRSQCYATVGKLKEAEADLTAAIGAKSDNPDDYITLERYKLAQGKIDDTTRDTIHTASSMVADRPWDAWTVAFHSMLVGDYENALKTAEHCDEVDKNDIKAAVYYRTNKLKEARACFDAASRKVTPYMIGTLSQKALMEISENQLPSAKVDIEEAESRDSDDPLPMLARGWYALASGDTKTALAKADDAIKHCNENNEIRGDKCHIVCASHDLKAAAYKKLGADATTDADKQKFAQLATDETSAAEIVPGPAFYSPIEHTT